MTHESSTGSEPRQITLEHIIHHIVRKGGVLVLPIIPSILCLFVTEGGRGTAFTNYAFYSLPLDASFTMFPLKLRLKEALLGVQVFVNGEMATSTTIVSPAAGTATRIVRLGRGGGGGNNVAANANTATGERETGVPDLLRNVGEFRETFL